MEITSLIEQYHSTKNYKGLLSKINKNKKIKEDTISLLEKFNFSVSLSEGIYLHLHNLSCPPKCLVCESPVKFKNVNVGCF